MPEEPQIGEKETQQSTSGCRRRDFLKLAGAFIASAGVAEMLAGCHPKSTPTVTEPAPPPPASTLPVSPSVTTPPTRPLTPTPAPEVTPPPPSPVAMSLTERQQIGHLLRRAGFGASEQELGQFTEMGVSATVDHLLDFEKVDDSALETRLSGINLNLDNLVDLQRWWYLRMIYTKRPLQEKMVLFWHGLLTSGYSKVGRGPYMYNQNQLFRRLALERYDKMLKAIARDPAMVIWLDSQVNRKSAPNENFARELMELFTLGVGNYHEGDVRESARAFTGWLLNQGAFFFNPNQHDFGYKSFLGRTGTFDGDDIINIILEEPASAEFISRKLFAFFAYDDPSPEVISQLAKVFRENRYSIKEVMRHLLTSAEFYSTKAYRAKIKSPAELVVATVRTLSIETDAAGLPGFADRIGQSLFNPFDVQGWPGGTTWINSNTILQRLNFANTVSTARSSNFRFNPQEATQRLRLTSAAEVINYYADLLLDGDISSETRTIMTDFASAVSSVPDGFSNSTNAIVDEKLRGLVYLMLASPDYQVG